MSSPSRIWQSKIVRFDPAVDPASLTPNPKNFRQHPEFQQQVIRASLTNLGWLDALKYNIRTNRLLDGHERLAEALTNGEPTVPVLYLDLSEEDENLALLTFDQSTSLAVADPTKLKELIAETEIHDEYLQQLVDDMAHLYLHSELEQNNEPPAPPKQVSYLVIVTCTSQSEQEQVFEELTEEYENVSVESR